MYVYYGYRSFGRVVAEKIIELVAHITNAILGNNWTNTSRYSKGINNIKITVKTGDIELINDEHNGKEKSVRQCGKATVGTTCIIIPEVFTTSNNGM